MNAPNPQPPPASDPFTDAQYVVAAYLSWMCGLPLVVPLAIYLGRGKDEPLVARHAIRGAIGGAVASACLVAVGPLFMLSGFALSAFERSSQRTPSLVLMLVPFLPPVGVAIWSLLEARSAYKDVIELGALQRARPPAV
ncbi:MAG: hypothetical protein U0271_13885 [Polyangiaceae bacterium]